MTPDGFSASADAFGEQPSNAQLSHARWNDGDAWRNVIATAALGVGSSTLRSRFASRGPGGFGLLPVRSTRLPSLSGRLLVTNEAGEFALLTEAEHAALLDGTLPRGTAAYDALLARHMIHEGQVAVPLRLLATKLRTKKAFVLEGPSLHIMVPTLRCDHSCGYCQVSRRRMDEAGYDMSPTHALAAVDRILESPAKALTVEFQGGEPLLAFDVIQRVTEEVTRRAAGRSVTFSMTSTLHHLTPEIAAFLRDHAFQLSASIDGPAAVHDSNRPVPGGNSLAKTLQGVALAREVLGPANVAAITTVTRSGLEQPEAMVNALVSLGFRSLFLRSVSPFGFAVRSARRTGYDMAAFLAFYERALRRILELNRGGLAVEEAYAAVLLRHMLTPFHSGYLDLRSPAGAGLGVLVYDHDGSVYASDEGRMLGATGDPTFRLGAVTEPLAQLMASAAMETLARGGVAEEQPGCRDCALVPWCGSDPVHHHATAGDVAADRLSSDFCQRHMGLFDLLLGLLEHGDAATRDVLLSWATRRWGTDGAPLA
ncbi:MULTISPECIES: His-Xaa-Ser system radical SAM maturase HxsB [Roseomonadaceae]|uniref:His-Xaa-Ser system radical SAM maturase HxsB n=1 Tax=Falsiroseomonas oleicola TaxID=2801474 RepID=A0ABS6HBN3_9PROT|nr:His-Xaa-Ser system radical SAM maturase HxsB [Roseomonas oleicola]MBU8546137.1 His-Xaa-Ser system radical SAM maturase HxsB [Roseomonas oleicola]